MPIPKRHQKGDDPLGDPGDDPHGETPYNSPRIASLIPRSLGLKNQQLSTDAPTKLGEKTRRSATFFLKVKNKRQFRLNFIGIGFVVGWMSALFAAA